jgi:hypothetical protein
MGINAVASIVGLGSVGAWSTADSVDSNIKAPS